jgi:hypothetical protein
MIWPQGFRLSQILCNAQMLMSRRQLQDLEMSPVDPHCMAVDVLHLLDLLCMIWLQGFRLSQIICNAQMLMSRRQLEDLEVSPLDPHYMAVDSAGLARGFGRPKAAEMVQTAAIVISAPMGS